MENFSKTLNWVALGIIVCIVGFFIYFVFSSFYHSQDKSNTPNPINFTLSEIHVKKADSTMISINKIFISDFNQKMDSLKVQIAELKEIKIKMEEIKKSNDDYLRLIFALIGSVFAIVGFFGFKSIHDTRENALKNAKIEAQNIAKIIAADEAKKTINEKYQEFFDEIDVLKGNYSNLNNSMENIEQLDNMLSQLKIRVDEIENKVSKEDILDFVSDVDAPIDMNQEETPNEQESKDMDDEFDEFADNGNK